MQDQTWLWLCLSCFSLKECPSPERSGRILAGKHTHTHARTHTDPTAPQTVIWQWPCGLNIWIWSEIILQWTSSHLSLDKLYWSLTINRVLHQLAAMPLAARENNRICVACQSVTFLSAWYIRNNAWTFLEVWNPVCSHSDSNAICEDLGGSYVTLML